MAAAFANSVYDLCNVAAPDAAQEGLDAFAETRLPKWQASYIDASSTACAAPPSDDLETVPDQAIAACSPKGC
jgi:hypothetical protein